MTPERLAELKEALLAFSTIKNDPHQQISEGKAARIAIKTKFQELSTLLEDRPGKQQGSPEEPPTKPQ